MKKRKLICVFCLFLLTSCSFENSSRTISKENSEIKEELRVEDSVTIKANKLDEIYQIERKKAKKIGRKLEEAYANSSEIVGGSIADYFADTSSLKELKENSEFIIDGVVTNTVVISSLDSNQFKSLNTRVEILVKQVYKGDKKLIGKKIREEELGGILPKEEWQADNQLTNEVTAEYIIDAPNDTPPSIIGQDVVIFLMKDGENYYPYGGNSGIFRLNQQTSKYERINEKYNASFNEENRQVNQEVNEMIEQQNKEK